MNGKFQALDAETGNALWSFHTPSGIIGHGKQWAVYMRSGGGDRALQNAPTGASLWTFALGLIAQGYKRSYKHTRVEDTAVNLAIGQHVIIV